MCGIAMLAAVVGIAGATGSCREHLITAATEPAALATIAVSNPCTRVGFRITGTKSVEGTMPPSPCPESPVAIEPGAAMEWMYQQHPKGSLKIKVRIRNQDAAAIGWPRLTLAPGGRTVLDPAGTHISTMMPKQADSVRLDGTAVWLLQPASGGSAPAMLASGAATASRMLQFEISAPTVEGAFEFNVLWEGEQDPVFPAVAPDSTPAWFHADSNFASNGIMRRVLKVRFELDATLAQKRAAVDSVGGVVVGGYRLTDDLEGIYYIHMPNVTSVSDLLDRGLILERQPGVRSAGVVDFGRSSGRRPRDDSGNENWAFEAVTAPAMERALAFDTLREGAQDNTGFPAVAPDSSPAWFRHDSSYVNSLLKRVLVVEFNPVDVNARKAAIDSVGGTVVGGEVWKAGDMGFYYIRIEGAVTFDSLETIAVVLRRQSAVRSVEFISRGIEGWRRPSDSTNWRLAADWSLSPFAGAPETWALTALAAPSAWGCAVGTATTKVGVIERSFDAECSA